jgi:DNA-binding SARP family transcriptional activator/tetratricopeptide (TPR) repeat protein
MRVEFGILGPLSVSRDGEPVRLGAGKQSALLAILLLNANEVVSADRLIEELWGDSAPETAAKGLQVHVSQLRKALEPARDSGDPGQIVVTRSPGYMLVLEPDQLDLTRFDRLVHEGREALAADDPDEAARLLRDALALWRGPPLSDFAYEQFAQSAISRLAELRTATLEQRLEADLAAGRHADVVSESEALVRAEPLRERPRAQLMLALYRSGRQAAALDAYRAAREALVTELGIEPGKELQRLHQAILDQDPTLDLVPRHGETVRPPTAGEGGAGEGARRESAARDFVGRERELSELRTALERAVAGGGSIYMLGGEPGIGKSRLADELAAVARERSATVLWGRCWEAGGAPAYWPWVQALRSYIAELDAAALGERLGARGSEIAQFLPELRERLPDLPVPAAPDSEGARFRLFESTADFIKRAAADTPLVFVLDDLHAADTPSLLLLRFIAGEIAGARVLVVGTFRDVEIGPDHPLDAALNDFARQQTTHVIALGGLEESDVSRLIATSAASTPSRRVVAAIHRGTGGNPLFVEELVQLLVSENRLDDAAGDTDIRVAIPRGVREVIGRRLETVTEDCRRTLGVAAVLGREFDLETLAEVTGRPAGELIDLLDEAVADRIVVEVPGMPDRLRFSHVLIRDVLYDELGAARRRRLHDRAGEALEELRSADPDPHLAELAYHFFEAGPTGDPGKALEYARRAGDRAVEQLAYEEAARLYELAIRVLRTAGQTDERARCELMLALAEARLRAGDEEEAKSTFLAAAEVARRLGDSRALARAALGYGGLVVWAAARGDPHLVPLLAEALAALPEPDSALRARLMARLSCALRDQPDRDRGIPLAEDAVAMSRRLDDPRALAYSLGALCVLITDPDSMERLAVTSLEVVEVAEGIGELERAFTGHLYHLCSKLSAGDIDGAKAALDALTKHGEDLRAPTYIWGSAEVAAALALLEGRFEAAGKAIERAYETGRRAQHFNATTAYELQRFLLHRERGGLERCAEGLREVATRWPTYRILAAALASLHAELGRTDDARAVLQELARDDFEQVYFDEEFLASMSLLADVCVALGDLERGARVYEKLAPHADRIAFGMIEIALGSVARPLGALATMLGRPDDAIAHFEAAIVTNERMGATPWVAHSRFGLGQALAGAGGRASADLAAEQISEAQAVYRELDMGPWERRAALALERLAVSTG